MDLYTRTGDDGTTGLFGGDRVGKDDPRVEAYGTVDELNAWIGLVVAALDEGRPVPARMRAMLVEIQSRLFDVGADLATPADNPHRGKVPTMTADRVTEIEGWIDEVDGDNEPMREFILPAGTEVASRLHAARAVCRRAERRIVNAARVTAITPHLIVYMNRLSDLLFAMARRANKDKGVADAPWEKKKR